MCIRSPNNPGSDLPPDFILTLLFVLISVRHYFCIFLVIKSFPPDLFSYFFAVPRWFSLPKY